MHVLLGPTRIQNLWETITSHLTFSFRFVPLRLQLYLWGRRIFWNIFVNLHFTQNRRKIFYVSWVFHQKLQQIFECVLICFFICTAVASCLGNIERPYCFEALVGYFLVRFFVFQTKRLYEVDKNADQLWILEVLDSSFRRHNTIWSLGMIWIMKYLQRYKIQ